MPLSPRHWRHHSQGSELGFGESWCYKGFGGPGGYFTAHLSDQMLSHQLGTYAMWWGLGSQALEPSVLLPVSCLTPTSSLRC